MKYLLSILFILLLSGCHQPTQTPMSNANVALALEQSHTLVKAGESVTFTAHASGVAGRDEKIRWEARGGDIKLLNNMDRYARVQYDKPGVYTVMASLYVDGTLVQSQQSVVQVDPLT